LPRRSERTAPTGIWASGLAAAQPAKQRKINPPASDHRVLVQTQNNANMRRHANEETKWR
jgi:hypothetical protein